MEMEEHFYSDDPLVGPPDVRTRLKDVDYFFLGNGLIQAAIQISRSGEGTPVGLIVFPPGVLGPKRNALTFDAETGLEKTQITVFTGRETFTPVAEEVTAQWTERNKAPVVSVFWRNGIVSVEERFFCPDRERPRLVRELHLKVDDPEQESVVLCTGRGLEETIQLHGGESGPVCLNYELREGISLRVEWCEPPVLSFGTARHGFGRARCFFNDPRLDHLFQASINQLPAVISDTGQVDGSIWQYNLEWVRDQSFMIRSLVLMGEFELAGTMLHRLFTQFVTSDGDTVDSGKVRPIEEVELDQNGELLHALKTYVDWTGDLSLVEEHWQKIKAVADFPLKKEFRHEPSGLLFNCREFWDRHEGYGILDGMELSYQCYVSLGLSCVADLAKLTGNEEDARWWSQEALRLKETMLKDERFSLVDRGRFIKRRALDGTVQEEITPREGADLFPGTPITEQGPHMLNPDTASVLPIALELIDPKSDLARNTLEDMEQLWNLNWKGGGYSRYHISSEPDSPGPWPFPSLFVARALLEAGEDERVWRVVDWLFKAPGSIAGSWFEFYGPRPVPPCPQPGFTPWTWAEIICLLIHHLLGVRPSGDSLLIRPRLLSGMEKASAALRFRGNRIFLSLRKTRNNAKAGFHVEDEFFPYQSSGLRIPLREGDYTVKVVLPSAEGEDGGTE